MNKEIDETYCVCHLFSNLFKFVDNFIRGLEDVGLGTKFEILHRFANCQCEARNIFAVVF